KAAAKPAPRRRRGARAAIDRVEHVTTVAAVAKTPVAKKQPQRKAAPKKPAGPPLVQLEEQVNAFERYVAADGTRWLLAATNRGLYRSTDPDKGWALIPTPGLAAPFAAISNVPNDPAHTIYLGTSRGLASTIDFGATWDSVHRGPGDDPVKSIVQDPREP